MATTTIPWGDGSGDNIYLTYSASQGDQTVLVSSDANGGVARTKNITFVSTVGNISRILTVSQEEGASLVSITWNNVCITYDDTAIGYPDTSPQYVKDGLVFWLDGIDKGEGADTWVDKVGGHVFTNHGAVFNPDHVYLDGNAYLVGSTTQLFPTTESGTIEVVFKKESEFGVIIVPPTGGTSATTVSQLSFGFISGYGLMWSNKTNRPKYSDNLAWGSVSISLARALGGGEALTQNGSSYLSLNSNSPAYIGKRNHSSTNPFTGEIYCIRMYNRQLTEEEVLHNLAVDNQRFYLGNNYIVFVDSEVESICATAWGDGTGLTGAQAAAVTNSQFTTQFRDNAQITSFDEFQYFTCLTQIYGNNSTSTPGAFGNCTSLKSITFGPNISLLYHYAFYNCTSLEEVTISRSFSSIYVGLWTNCTALKRFNIPSISVWLDCTLSSYHPFAASGEGHLYIGSSEVTTVTIPSTIEEIKTYAFYHCVGIASFDIPSSVTSIGTYAFTGCSGLTAVTGMSGVRTLGRSAFSNCTALTSDINLPSLTGTLPTLTFAYTAITKVVSLGSITTIESNTFSNCTALEEVALPSTLTSVGQTAFQNCTAVEKINITDLAAYYGITFATSANPFHYSTADSRGLYLNGVLVTNLVIPNTVTAIGASQFYKNNTITSVTIPSSVTSIGGSAFGYTGLTGVSIPSSVTSIGGNAFIGCLAIKDMTIESTATIASNICSTTAASTCGDGTGTFHHYGSMTNASNFMFNFRRIIIDGDFSNTNNSPLRYLVTNGAGTFEAMKIGGNYSTTGTNAGNSKPITPNVGMSSAAGQKYSFLEIMGTITSSYCILGADNYNSLNAGFILHLGYDTVTNNALPCTPVIAGASFTRLAKIYVGDGSSAAHDDAILAQYTADTDWSAYSSKLDTWYNYINDPNANSDYIN